MNIKKTLILMVIFLILFLSKETFGAESFDIDNKDRSEIFKKACFEWLDSFKQENIPEEERIISYSLIMYGVSDSNESKIKVELYYEVVPVSKNTIWKEKNICFLEMANINGEYKVEYISRFPKRYEEFSEKFNEYEIKKTKDITQMHQITENLPNQKIRQINNWLVTALVIVLLGVIIFIIKKTCVTSRNKGMVDL